MSLIIVLRNVSNLAEISDYEYRVQINDRVIERGTVERHPRAAGWPALCRRLAEDRTVTHTEAACEWERVMELLTKAHRGL